MTGKQEKRWTVVCTAYVSATFPTKEAAQEHLKTTRDVNLKCPSPHQVIYTDLKYGTRAREVKP